MKRTSIAAADVPWTLARHMIADGYDLVLDLEKSRGRRLWDARGGGHLLDLFSFFATLPMPCGPRSLRFRPPLDTTREEVDEGLDVIARAIERAATAAA